LVQLTKGGQEQKAQGQVSKIAIDLLIFTKVSRDGKNPITRKQTPENQIPDPDPKKSACFHKNRDWIFIYHIEKIRKLTEITFKKKINSFVFLLLGYHL